MKKQLSLLLIVVFLLAACSKNKQDIAAPKDFNGCLGYAAGYSNSGTLGKAGVYDFNNAQNNTFFANEVKNQRAFWLQIPASVYVLYEPAFNFRNAYATTDGKIYFGFQMFNYLVEQFSVLSPTEVSPLPVDGVLAHEWGHRVQFVLGWNDYANNSQRELEADYMSGYYLGLQKQMYWSQLQTYYTAIYCSGDYLYASPDHHGTPNQRMNAAYTGLLVAAYELNHSVHYTYAQLHAGFKNNLDYINNHISMVKKGSTLTYNFKEVIYPDKINKDVIERLKPTI